MEKSVRNGWFQGRRRRSWLQNLPKSLSISTTISNRIQYNQIALDLKSVAHARAFSKFLHNHIELLFRWINWLWTMQFIPSWIRDVGFPNSYRLLLLLLILILPWSMTAQHRSFKTLRNTFLTFYFHLKFSRTHIFSHNSCFIYSNRILLWTLSWLSSWILMTY